MGARSACRALSRAAVEGEPVTVERLSWASGPVVVDGWHHSDVRWYSGMDVLFPGFSAPLPVRDHIGLIQDGLPWEDGTMDYVVSHHGLMMLPEPDLIPALSELRRVTKPGGWLRMSVPDMGAAVTAWMRQEQIWFPVDARDCDEAFCRYVTQNGATRSIFTRLRLRSLLLDAGWRIPRPSVAYQSNGPEGITDLDSRPNESLYMEAVKG